MRILFVTPYFYPRKGGLEHYALNIARSMVSRGHEVRVVCQGVESGCETLEGIKILRLKPDLVFSNTPVRVDLACSLSRIVRNWKPDLVNAHTPVIYSADVAALVSRAHSVPFVLTHHNENVHERIALHLIARFYSHTLYLLTLKLAGAIIAASPFSYHESPFLKLFQEKTVWIPPGVDLSLYSINGSHYLRQVYGLSPNARIALFVGNMSGAHRHKGLDVLLPAFGRVCREIPNSYLVLVGSGDRVPHYKSISRQMGILNHVIFTGQVSEPDLVMSYQSADLVVLPSTSVQEGFGMVLLESAACGKPVIGSSIGGIKYFVRHEIDGLLVPPRNESALSQALVTLFKNKDMCREMGDAGRLKAMDYDWSIIAARTEEVFLTQFGMRT